MTPVLIAATCGLIASVAWALANIYIQRTSRELGVMLPLFWGQVSGAAMLACALVWWPARDIPSDPAWLLVGGAACALAYVAMFKAFEGGPVSAVSPMIAGWALISAALGVTVFDELLTTARWVGSLLIIGGVIGFLLVATDRKTGPRGEGWRTTPAKALSYALASALGFGVMVTAMRPIGQQLGPVASVLALWATQWLFLLPFLVRRPTRNLIPPVGSYTAILCFGLLETIGFVAVNLGASMGPVSVVAPCASISALLTVGLGSLWLGEHVPPSRWLFAAIVVAGVVTLSTS